MSAAFTPPPWKFERMDSAVEYAELTGKTLEEHDGYFRSNNGNWIVSRTDPDGETGGSICEVTFRGKAKRGEAYKTPDTEGQANAHLIAAAPELYEALGVCLAMAERALKSSMNLRGKSPYDIGIEALRKARGEQ